MFDSVLNMSRVLNIPASESARVLNIPFPKYKKVPLFQSSGYIFPEIQGFFSGFHFLKYKKVPFPETQESFLLRKYKKFLILEQENFISWNMRNFLMLELESSISWNIRNFFRGGFFFIFQVWKVLSWNIRKIWG